MFYTDNLDVILKKIYIYSILEKNTMSNEVFNSFPDDSSIPSALIFEYDSELNSYSISDEERIETGYYDALARSAASQQTNEAPCPHCHRG